MNNLLDEELAALAMKGDKEALESLISRYLGQIYGLAYRYVKNQAEAEDIAQEVFIKVWRNLKKFDQTKLFRPWLYKVAINTCLDFLKKKPDLPFSNFDTAEGFNWLEQNLADQSPSLGEVVDNSILNNELSDSIHKLTPKYAEVVILHHDKGLNFRQISELTKESLNTVKSRYRRALVQLRELLSK